MRKFFITIIALVCLAICVGRYYGNTYTEIDLNDSEVIDKARVTKWFDEGVFIIEESEVDPNKYVIDPETGEIIEVIKPEEAMKEEITPRDELIREELDNAEIVIRAECISGVKNCSSTCVQDVKVSEVYKGDKLLEGKEIKVASVNCFSFNEEIWVTTETNLMKNGKEYLIFINSTGHDALYRVQNFYGAGYFALDDMESEIIEKSKNTKYADVKDNEFFVSDQVALDKITEIKKDMLEKYLNK